MHDDAGVRDEGRQVRNALTRISDALRVPIAVFYDADAETVEPPRRDEEAHLLERVQAYIRHVDREDAQRFVTAVQALVEDRNR
jgi:hypothetical protein